MGIGTYIKIGVLVLALVIGFGGAWYIQSLRADNKRLVQENKDQAKTIAFLQAAAAIDTATAKNKEEIHEAVKTGDPNRIHDVLHKLHQMSGQGSFQPGEPASGS